MQSIRTKYLKATDTRGERIKATSSSGQSVTVPWYYAPDVEENHARAAHALAEKLGWKGSFTGAGLDDSGFVFVPDSSDLGFIV